MLVAVVHQKPEKPPNDLVLVRLDPTSIFPTVSIVPEHYFVGHPQYHPSDVEAYSASFSLWINASRALSTAISRFSITFSSLSVTFTPPVTLSDSVLVNINSGRQPAKRPIWLCLQHFPRQPVGWYRGSHRGRLSRCPSRGAARPPEGQKHNH